MWLENEQCYHIYRYDAAQQVHDAEGVEAFWGMWEVFVVATIQAMDDDKLAEVFWHARLH